MSTAVALASHPALRIESLRALLPAAPPPTAGMPTGVVGLDDVLAAGGLPRGRLTEIVGATGTLTLLREIVRATIARGECVAYIDASRTLAPRDWAGVASAGLWIVRPREAAKAAWCADVLLRSAAFSIVVLDSAPPLSRAIAVRLSGLARDGNAVFVAAGARDTTRLGGAVRLRVDRRRQRLRITIEKGGSVVGTGNSQRVVEVGCANAVARRLCTYSEVPDRRGTARAAAGKRGKGRRAASPDAYRAGGGMLRYC